VSDNQLFLEAGERRLMARLIDVNFPNYMEVISRDNDRHVMVDRERLLSTIRRISLVANERTRAVRFDFAPGKLTVSSTNPELGDARETVPIDYSGNPFFVGLNAAYVTGVLQREVEKTLSVGLESGESKKRVLMINGERVTLPLYLNAMSVFAYSASRLEIIRGAPEERRRFLDRGIASVNPAYLEQLT